MTSTDTFFIPAAPGTKLAMFHRESQTADMLPLLGWMHPKGTDRAAGAPVVVLGGLSRTLDRRGLSDFVIAGAFYDPDDDTPEAEHLERWRQQQIAEQPSPTARLRRFVSDHGPVTTRQTAKWFYGQPDPAEHRINYVRERLRVLAEAGLIREQKPAPGGATVWTAEKRESDR
jgi:hypothetical protein